MPVRRGQDAKGSFYRWGDSGAKKYYTPGDPSSRSVAKAAAEQQGRAIRAAQRARGR